MNIWISPIISECLDHSLLASLVSIYGQDIEKPKGFFICLFCFAQLYEDDYHSIIIAKLSIWTDHPGISKMENDFFLQFFSIPWLEQKLAKGPFFFHPSFFSMVLWVIMPWGCPVIRYLVILELSWKGEGAFLCNSLIFLPF